MNNKFFNLNLVIIILALFFALGIFRAQGKIIQQLKEKKSLEIKKNEILSSISKLEQKINEYKKKFEKTDSSSLMDAVRDMAKGAGVRVVSIAPAAQKDQGVYAKSPLTVVVNAKDYHAIGKFISKIESYTKIRIVVDNVVISPASSPQYKGEAGEQPKDKNEKVRAQITLSTIAFKG